MKKITFCFLMLLLCAKSTWAQPTAESTHDAKMRWWREARFGLFIHWGVYARFGGMYHGIRQQLGGSEWLLNYMKVPVKEYMDTARNFNPVAYDPDKWVKLAKDAGMKYIVITTKHHDGFALFKTKASKWNIEDATPYGKDLIAPLAKACRKHGLRLGFYYSHAQDWVNPGGGVGPKAARLGYANPDSVRIDSFAKIHDGHWDPVQVTASYDEYIDRVAIPQLKELLTQYGKIDILWWDTPHRTNTAQAERFAQVLGLQPGIITNDRLKKPYNLGDYKTPEGRVPNLSELDGKDWEACQTMNASWGYLNPKYDRWRSSKDLIRVLIDIASKGGNFLLNIPPDPTGRFPEPGVAILQDFSKWMGLYGEAIYGTRANPVGLADWGRITARDKKGGTTLYLSVFNWPADGKLKVDSVFTKAVSAHVTGQRNQLRITQSKTGALELSGLPAVAPNNVATVITVKFQGIIDKKELKAGAKMKTGELDM